MKKIIALLIVSLFMSTVLIGQSRKSSHTPKPSSTKSSNTTTRSRSAETGKYVTKENARQNPSTTVTEKSKATKSK